MEFYVSFSINLTTLEMFSEKFKNKKDAKKFIEKKIKRYKIKSPKNSEDFVLSKLGKRFMKRFDKTIRSSRKWANTLKICLTK